MNYLNKYDELCDSDVAFIGLTYSSTNPRTRSRAQTESYRINKNEEDYINGIITCPIPKCRNMIISSERGCKVQVCMQSTRHPNNGWYYFCYHCKRELPGGEPSECPKGCPNRNSITDRVWVRDNIR